MMVSIHLTVILGSTAPAKEEEEEEEGFSGRETGSGLRTQYIYWLLSLI